ncbi:hypothetical protein [Streptomyces sp. NPDC052496]|uniref:hypothetical protein n=1 Tax=Streptomyces sp. NPDC052496 TaxID=3154951 RepID=UPI00343C0A61
MWFASDLCLVPMDHVPLPLRVADTALADAEKLAGTLSPVAVPAPSSRKVSRAPLGRP